jgi:hypothetical protein
MGSQALKQVLCLHTPAAVAFQRERRKGIASRVELIDLIVVKLLSRCSLGR